MKDSLIAFFAILWLIVIFLPEIFYLIGVTP